MTTLERLDSMLQVFVDNRFKQQIDLAYLYKESGKMGIEFGEVSDVLRKLLADGYLEMIESGTPNTDDYKVFYKVSFNGLVFNEQKGYTNQRIQDHLSRANQKSLVFLTWVIALGTAVAAVYYGIEVWKFLCHH